MTNADMYFLLINGTVEDSLVLNEMANCTKAATGLSMNLWLDESQCYVNGRHGKRVKVQLNKAETVQWDNFASITLYNSKIIAKEEVLKRKRCELSWRELSGAENFVYNNNCALNLLADKKIRFKDFLLVMIKDGKIADKKIIWQAAHKVCILYKKRQSSV